MPNLNKAMLIGNLVADCEVKYTQSGKAVANIRLAINRTLPKGEDGEKREDVEFIDVTLWGRVAEICSEYTRKGDPVYIEGRLHVEQWEKDEEKRSKVVVIGESLQLLGNRRGPNPGERGSKTHSEQSRPARPPQPEDDDIPF